MSSDDLQDVSFQGDVGTRFDVDEWPTSVAVV